MLIRNCQNFFVSFNLKWKTFILLPCVLTLDILWPALWSFNSVSSYACTYPRFKGTSWWFLKVSLSSPSYLLFFSTASICLLLPEFQSLSLQLSKITRCSMSPSSFWTCSGFPHGLEISSTEKAEVTIDLISFIFQYPWSQCYVARCPTHKNSSIHFCPVPVVYSGQSRSLLFTRSHLEMFSLFFNCYNKILPHWIFVAFTLYV